MGKGLLIRESQHEILNKFEVPAAPRRDQAGNDGS